MKNQNKVREYTGYYFRFELNKNMYRFFELYKDLFVTYEFIEHKDDCLLKVQAKKGFIPGLKKDLKGMIKNEGHNRYYIKAA